MHASGTRRCRRIALVALATAIVGAWGGVAIAQSVDAQTREVLMREIAEACEGARGKIAREGAIERDLDGDGRDDLIVSHEYIDCGDGGMFGRSLYCGMQVCSVNVYMRGPDGLVLELETLGGGVEVGPGPMPTVRMYQHGGGEASFTMESAR
jgi:hypothetical protein